MDSEACGHQDDGLRRQAARREVSDKTKLRQRNAIKVQPKVASRIVGHGSSLIGLSITGSNL